MPIVYFSVQFSLKAADALLFFTMVGAPLSRAPACR
jgi:hypothetical protein